MQSRGAATDADGMLLAKDTSCGRTQLQEPPWVRQEDASPGDTSNKPSGELLPLSQLEPCCASTMHSNAFMQVKARKRRMQRWPRGSALLSSRALCLSLLGWVLDAQTVIHC